MLRSKKPQDRIMSRVAVVCPEDVIVISHFCLLFLVFVPDGISLLCSADEESPYLLFGLKEGQDRLILITSNGGFGLWFQDWKMSNVFHFSCPHRQKGLLSLYWWIHSAKPRSLWQLISFSSLLSFPLVAFITSTLFGCFALPAGHFPPKAFWITPLKTVNENMKMNFYNFLIQMCWC